MDPNNLSFGQKIDESNGLIMPWFSHGSLQAISKMDLSDKIIWMFGSGLGDAWLARRCKKLYIVERNVEWLYKSSEHSAANGATNIVYIPRPCNDSSGQAEYYMNFEGVEPDIIINDDAYRTEVCFMAVDYFKKKGGGILICDNWWQDYVWKSPAAMELLEPFKKNIYHQLDHIDHEGDCWKTAIIFIK